MTDASKMRLRFLCNAGSLLAALAAVTAVVLVRWEVYETALTSLARAVLALLSDQASSVPVAVHVAAIGTAVLTPSFVVLLYHHASGVRAALDQFQPGDDTAMRVASDAFMGEVLHRSLAILLLLLGVTASINWEWALYRVLSTEGVTVSVLATISWSQVDATFGAILTILSLVVPVWLAAALHRGLAAVHQLPWFAPRSGLKAAGQSQLSPREI